MICKITIQICHSGTILQPVPKKPYVPRITTVKPWTSLDIAKPSWEDSDQASPDLEPEDEHNHDINSPTTYGAWNKDNLKLEAVPFSRAT